MKSLGEDQAVKIVLTFNPGYAGRCELPDGFVSRGIRMMIPDYSLIAQVHLATKGLKSNMNDEFSQAKFICQVLSDLQK